MNRTDTLKLLAEHKPELAKRFGVERLALLGLWGQALHFTSPSAEIRN